MKALISDGTHSREVDALRVFSESQVNVIGIAAYVTRSRLLGHGVLMFDDPVQSMDEEHWRTFASDLITSLLDDGFQVLVLTHSDSFAQTLSYFHFRRANYATMRTRFSRRNGCLVDEGSRRVSERLKVAGKLSEEGRLDEAWLLIRLSIERLYTLVKASVESRFVPESWRDQTADYMWSQGVGSAIEGAVPNAGARLKEILGQSVFGAHDKSAASQTDVHNAISYIRGILTPLRIGD